MTIGSDTKGNDMVDLTISLVTANNKKLILDCLESIYDNRDDLEIETYVVINVSADDSEAAIRERFPEVRLIVNAAKLGFTHNHNMVMRRGRGRHYLVLNDDTVIRDNALRRMVDFMDASPDVGILGCRILNTDGSLQWSCGKSVTAKAEFFKSGVLRTCLPFLPVRHFDTVTDVTWVTGACLMARAEAVREVGLFDENIVIYFEDGDWCYRMTRANWRVVFFPEAEIIHYHGQTRKQHLARDLYIIYQSRCYFFAKHYSRLAEWLVRLFTLVEVSLRYAVVLPGTMRRGEAGDARREMRCAYGRIMRMALASDFHPGGKSRLPGKT